MSISYSYSHVKDNLKECGYYLDTKEEDYKGVTTCNLLCHDDNGYKYDLVYDSTIRGVKPRVVAKCNPYVIYNINNFLKINGKEFTCISDKAEYQSKKSLLSFVCNRCGEVIKKSWNNVLRKRDNYETTVCINCPNCDGRTESLHALILKQVFSFYYPDTIEEDKSCINPITGKIMPTDIVNHRLKIAIEIQSQWHDFADHKAKDKFKKEYWVNRGYKFYDPDIRDYTPLQMCQLFFNIQELPNFINYDYKNKLNIKEIQEMLNSGKNVHEIAQILDINPHRIYDAIYSKKLNYPDNYISGSYTQVECYDINWKFLKKYNSIKEAAEELQIEASKITSCLFKKRSTCCGYNWKYA